MSIENNKISNLEFLAELDFLTTEQGGRRSPVFSGYRGQFHYNDWDCLASYDFQNKDQVNPGDKVVAKVDLAFREIHEKNINKGFKFKIREGARVVAERIVKEVLN